MSTRIVFRDGLSLATLPASTVRAVVDQAVLLDKLAALKREWSEATGGELHQVQVNLKLLFEDFERIITEVDHAA